MLAVVTISNVRLEIESTHAGNYKQHINEFNNNTFKKTTNNNKITCLSVAKGPENADVRMIVSTVVVSMIERTMRSAT
jgi:hypothetical protein